MAQLKKQEHTEETESWLISYADMMTLVANFFILMMAFASYDPVGFQKYGQEVAKAFNKQKNKSSTLELKTNNEVLAKHPDQKVKEKISIKDGNFIVSLNASVLFNPGEFKINQKSKDTIDSIIQVIKTKNPNFRVVVEGHSDGDKDLISSFSAWEISGLRASKVIERFEYFGFEPKKLISISYGDTNHVEDGEANPTIKNQNRRVVIKVLEPVSGKAQSKLKLGLGVIFSD